MFFLIVHFFVYSQNGQWNALRSCVSPFKKYLSQRSEIGELGAWIRQGRVESTQVDWLWLVDALYRRSKTQSSGGILVLRCTWSIEEIVHRGLRSMESRCHCLHATKWCPSILRKEWRSHQSFNCSRRIYIPTRTVPRCIGWSHGVCVYTAFLQHWVSIHSWTSSHTSLAGGQLWPRVAPQMQERGSWYRYCDWTANGPYATVVDRSALFQTHTTQSTSRR